MRQKAKNDGLGESKPATPTVHRELGRVVEANEDRSTNDGQAANVHPIALRMLRVNALNLRANGANWHIVLG